MKSYLIIQSCDLYTGIYLSLSKEICVFLVKVTNQKPNNTDLGLCGPVVMVIDF